MENANDFGIFKDYWHIAKFTFRQKICCFSYQITYYDQIYAFLEIKPTKYYYKMANNGYDRWDIELKNLNVGDFIIVNVSLQTIPAGISCMRLCKRPQR